MPDETVLICSPCDRPSHGEVVKFWCSVCAVEIWVSVPLEDEVRVGNIRPVCMDCAPGVLEAADEHVMAIHPKQRASLAKRGLLEPLEAFVAKKNEAERRKRG